jgi:uncharacterized protein (DUF1330 family)
MAEYGKLARDSIARYGGKILAAGPTETVEGDWTPNRLALIEFDSMDKLKTGYDSSEYQAALPLRLRSAATTWSASAAFEGPRCNRLPGSKQSSGGFDARFAGITTRDRSLARDCALS